MVEEAALSDPWYGNLAEMTSDSKYADWLREVYKYAKAHSNDISTYTAASIVDKKDKTRVIDSNHFHEAAFKVPGWNEKPLKDGISQHAERAVVAKAAKDGIKTNGFTMVMPWIPCFPCATSMIDSGVKTFVCHKQMVDRTPVDWIPELSKVVKFLKDAGIRIIMYDGHVGGCEGFMRKENWKP